MRHIIAIGTASAIGIAMIFVTFDFAFAQSKTKQETILEKYTPDTPAAAPKKQSSPKKPTAAAKQEPVLEQYTPAPTQKKTPPTKPTTVPKQTPVPKPAAVPTQTQVRRASTAGAAVTIKGTSNYARSAHFLPSGAHR